MAMFPTAMTEATVARIHIGRFLRLWFYLALVNAPEASRML